MMIRRDLMHLVPAALEGEKQTSKSADFLHSRRPEDGLQEGTKGDTVKSDQDCTLSLKRRIAVIVLREAW
jgi:hypothetical protein